MVKIPKYSLKTFFMKNFFLLIALCLLNFTEIFSQGTTQEEYNYCVKGYKAQIENGLDMKKGYTFTDLGIFFGDAMTAEQLVDNLTNELEGKKGKSIRKCEFKGLIRAGQKNPCAIMMIYQNITSMSTEYVCIPSPESSYEIMKQTLDFVKLKFKSEDVTSAVMYALMQFSIQQTTK